jgi:curved DNA-binding protein CbpA
VSKKILVPVSDLFFPSFKILLLKGSMESRGLYVSSRVSPVSTKSRLPPASPPCLSPRSPHAAHSPSSSASIFCYSPSLDYSSSSIADQQSLQGSSSFYGKQFSWPGCSNTSPKFEAFYSAEQPAAGSSDFPASSSSSPSESPSTESPESSPSSPPPSPSVSKTSLTYYELLGVAQNATAKEIRVAYRQKALHYHPDVAAPWGEQQRFNDIFAEINEAYSILTDPHRRSLYDAKLLASDSSRRFIRGPRGGPVTIPAGFNSYSYQFTGFMKPDIWAVAGGNSQQVAAAAAAAGGSSTRASSYPGSSVAPDHDHQDSGHGSSTPPPHCSTSCSGSATSSVDTRNISSSWRGRNWETDQCWC